MRGAMAGADKEAKKRERQKRYRDQHHERLKALNRQRYQARIKRLKTSGEYETFKAKNAVEGLKRYWDMTEEAREERKRKNSHTQKAWREKMKQEGTYKAYRTRINAHRRAQTAAKRQAMGEDAYRAYQHQQYMRRRDLEREKREQTFLREVEPYLVQPFPLPWVPLEWVEEKEGEGSRAAPLPCPEVRDCCRQMMDVA